MKHGKRPKRMQGQRASRRLTTADSKRLPDTNISLDDQKEPPGIWEVTMGPRQRRVSAYSEDEAILSAIKHWLAKGYLTHEKLAHPPPTTIQMLGK